MAPGKHSKHRNEENNLDVEEHDDSPVVEVDFAKLLGWICKKCNVAALDPGQLELQSFETKGYLVDGDGVCWLRCEHCLDSIHVLCIPYVCCGKTHFPDL